MGFLLSNPLSSLLAVLLLAVSLFAGLQRAELRHAQDQLAQCSAAMAVAKAEADRLRKIQPQITERIVTQWRDRRTAQAPKEQVIHEQIAQLVDPLDRLPTGFVLLHDAAARGEPADAAQRTDDAAEGVALSFAADVIVANYAGCRQNADQLSALQAWVAAQAEAK